jgi:uncharacterized protein (TIGR02996 family)
VRNLDYISEPEYRTQLVAVQQNPADLTRRGVFADWIQEHGDDEEAERIRRADPLLLFSRVTGSGTFTVAADWVALLWPWPVPGVDYLLLNDRFPDFSATFRSPYIAIAECAQHRIGVPEWDDSTEVVPDYAAEWDRHTNGDLDRRLSGYAPSDAPLARSEARTEAQAEPGLPCPRRQFLPGGWWELRTDWHGTRKIVYNRAKKVVGSPLARSKECSTRSHPRRPTTCTSSSRASDSC